HRKASEAEKRQRASLQGAMAILVTDDAIEEIRRAARDVDTADARLAAAATTVSFDILPEHLSAFSVNGDALSAETTSIQVVKPTTVAIPEYGRITIEPA